MRARKIRLRKSEELALLRLFSVGLEVLFTLPKEKLESFKAAELAVGAALNLGPALGWPIDIPTRQN